MSKTMEEILNTPVLLLTEAEIDQLDTESQIWARKCHANKVKYENCPEHEPVGISQRNGWHRLSCKHCGKDMSYDSGD